MSADLKQALVDLVGVKLLEVANFSSTTADTDGVETTTTPLGTLKRVQTDSYSEEYSTTQADAYWKAKAVQLSRTIGDGIPTGIMETISHYQRLIAL